MPKKKLSKGFNNMFQPYNPAKIFCHHKTWLNVAQWVHDIQDDPEHAWLPAPITVSIDPANVCNMKCLYCNADFVLNKHNGEMMSREYLAELASFLYDWEVRGACLGGGGEALCNPHVGEFIENLSKTYGIGVGIVTNGLLIDRVPELQYIDWCGVSVDAGTAETWGLVHGVKPELFDRVLKNMQSLYAKNVHVTYKYLVRPESVNEVYEGIKRAWGLGILNFHIRPGAPPWFEDTKKEFFTDDDVTNVQEQLSRAKNDFPAMNIIGVFNKVGKHWQVEHPFSRCHAVLATCVFQANKKIGFCCDNRSNPALEIGPFNDPKKILDFWGSKAHYDLVCSKCISSCPRCTFAVFNSYFEKCVLDDKFMLDFI
jgi:MoaA/NifB/PqqE/SkfB family radical SAM enzyme